MLRNYLVTALRNLERNRLYAAISILGLAMAFAAAMLIAQFVRGEFSYDRWIPGYQQVYRVTSLIKQSGRSPTLSELSPPPLKAQLQSLIPGASVTRLIQDFEHVRHRGGDEDVIDEPFAWVDPDFFEVLPLLAAAGDLKSALRQPDAVVITRRMARRYFGRDLPLGDTLEIETRQGLRAMRVTAVLEDLPTNSNLAYEIYANGRAAYSLMTVMDRIATYRNSNLYTFVRLPASVPASDLQRALDVAARPAAAQISGDSKGADAFSYGLVSLPAAHFLRPTVTSEVSKPPGDRGVAYAIAGAGALIVLVAAINFVTLMTARAARRGVEVGVRKATGAGRRDLIVQFVGEALMQVAFSVLIAAVLAELLIGPFGAFVQRGLSLDVLHDPALLPGVVGTALVIGLAASIYPALVLSGFRPAVVLKGGPIQASGSPVARQALVVIQFAILVGLIVTTATVYRQTQYALNRGLGGADADRIVRIRFACMGPFPDAVRALPGVGAAGCSNPNALNSPIMKNFLPVKVAGGQEVSFTFASVGFGFFEVYGMRPLAGRLFSPKHGPDTVAREPNAFFQQPVIINETAARKLGFSDPRAVIGRQMIWFFSRKQGAAASPASSEIIGVVPDRPDTVRIATEPTFYLAEPDALEALSIKLTGQDMPGTLRAIKALWKRLGYRGPVNVTFVSQYEQSLYLDLITQGGIIAGCATLAVLIACLGLYALSAFTTERRTKEIGVRKAMGASTRDVMLLLLWQFSIPVLAATAIAIPGGALAMQWWLHGFAYHVDLSGWTLILAAVAAVGVAWLTVSYQSFIVARAKPVSALRYE